MIAIVNIDDHPRRTGLHTYVLKINQDVIVQFQHRREDPLHVCLLRAILALETDGKYGVAAP